ncbi:MAG: hypothetical protein AAFV43_14385 [Planctomycetota bacterium]
MASRSRRFPLALAVGGACVGAMLGCSKAAPTVPNPFQLNDRVPPPIAHAAPLQPAPYYGSAPSAAGVPLGSPGTFASPAPLSPGPGAIMPAPVQPAPAGTLGAPQPFPSAPAPQGGFQQPSYGQPAPLGQSRSAVPGGDAVAIAADTAPLRFASPSPRPPAQPAQPAAAALAGGAANGWIAGSAPVRRPTRPSAPTTRLPSSVGGREPVSIAALGGGRGGVQITPLDTPSAPVSVADSNSAAATWR